MLWMWWEAMVMGNDDRKDAAAKNGVVVNWGNQLTAMPKDTEATRLSLMSQGKTLGQIATQAKYSTSRHWCELEQPAHSKWRRTLSDNCCG